MPLDVVVGTQWGDEGKGRIVDLLAAQANLVVRYNGGDNAGHTVSVGSELFRLHLVPSGILHSHTMCALGAGMAINPARLVDELDQLQAQRVDASPQRLKISTAAHLITPVHLVLDGAEEARRGSDELGTTRRGIGPAYTDKAARRGLRAEAMRDPEAFATLIEARLQEAPADLQPTLPDPVATGRAYGELASRLRPYLADVGALVAQTLDDNRVVLAEGAQGTLLDLDHGTYPCVTSSHPTAPGALVGLGIGARTLRRIVGVTKAFQTRVGAGPFPTELHGPAAERLRGSGQNPWDEFGTTTGRPRRCGWLDVALLRYAIRINGLTELAITKLDVLSGLKRLQICTAYQLGTSPPTESVDSLSDLSDVRPIYEELPGWPDDLTGVRAWDDLPSPATAYIERLESLCGVRVRLISVGPEREQVIDRGRAP
jgi:adenylosuccinate synthase